MAMDLNARAAYIRGLMTGMEFDAASPTGKVIAAMMDLLEQMAAAITEHDDALDEISEDVAALDEDMDEVVAVLSGEELPADDGEDEAAPEGADDALYEVTCPNCGHVTTVDEDTLMTEELVCPTCGAAFDIELEGESDGEAEAEEEAPSPASLFVMPEDVDGQ